MPKAEAGVRVGEAGAGDGEDEAHRRKKLAMGSTFQLKMEVTNTIKRLFMGRCALR